MHGRVETIGINDFCIYWRKRRMGGAYDHSDIADVLGASYHPPPSVCRCQKWTLSSRVRWFVFLGDTCTDSKKLRPVALFIETVNPIGNPRQMTKFSRGLMLIARTHHITNRLWNVMENTAWIDLQIVWFGRRGGCWLPLPATTFSPNVNPKHGPRTLFYCSQMPKVKSQAVEHAATL